ncbi:hypothetical protein [Deefgea sp. CFH1-16]|uniref:hypothetical protein n=1 Tax=Deefgea sp. CFH1-16 TaxID=2675457 RepID=UPI0015F3A667|nr:hypothetical protein [Deefgea sp. CFH1-16]
MSAKFDQREIDEAKLGKKIIAVMGIGMIGPYQFEVCASWIAHYFNSPFAWLKWVFCPSDSVKALPAQCEHCRCAVVQMMRQRTNSAVIPRLGLILSAISSIKYMIGSNER